MLASPSVLFPIFFLKPVKVFSGNADFYNTCIGGSGSVDGVNFWGILT
jgi:hypothetical protein